MLMVDNQTQMRRFACTGMKGQEEDKMAPVPDAARKPGSTLEGRWSAHRFDRLRGNSKAWLDMIVQ